MQNIAGSPTASIVIGVILVVFICYRQLQTRAVREDRGVTLFLVMLVIGVYQTLTFTQTHTVELAPALVTGASLIVGLGLGVVRGLLVHVWREGDKLLRRGNLLTILAWVVGVAIHLGIDLFGRQLGSSAAGLASNSLLIYIALSLGAQRFIVLRRAKAIDERPEGAPTRY